MPYKPDPKEPIKLDLTGTDDNKILRLRYYYKFESIWIIKGIEEITFRNPSTERSVNEIIINDYPFRHNLNVYNSDNELLCYKFEKEKIFIKLPQMKWLQFEECRTLKLEYYINVEPDENNNLTTLPIPLRKADSISVYIEENKEYEFVVANIRSSIDRTHITDYLTENEDNNKITKKFVWLYLTNVTNNITLNIVITHKLILGIECWLRIGLLSGIISIASIILLQLNDSNKIGEITAISAISIPIMTFIRGLFTPKDIGALYKKYDMYYLITIGLIFILFFYCVYLDYLSFILPEFIKEFIKITNIIINGSKAWK